MFIRKTFGDPREGWARRVDKANEAFNRLSKRRKKYAVLGFGISVTLCSTFLIVQAFKKEESKNHFKPNKITMPYDIFMEDEARTTEDQLTPVGKMKGEIDGEFESFYVAVDNTGTIYINRDIEYSERAYEKTDDWKQISREKLMEYEKALHFMPSKGRGVKN
jgi:hypothetical protein